MIVEPTPTNPRSPVRRALSLAGLALPVALLIAIVGAGVAGPKPQPEPVAPDASHATVAEEPSASPVPAASPTAPTAVAAPTGPGPGFPKGAAGLPVLSIPEAQGPLATGDGLPIAVAGFLEGLRAADPCAAATGDTRGPLSPLCERRARLVMIGDFGWRSGVHLHLRFPPGVRLPAVFEDASPDGPIPVVIVGRGGGPSSPCAATERGCVEQMTADLVAWADGDPFEPGPVFDAGLEVPPPDIAYRHLDAALSLAIGGSGTVLISAVVRPATVAAIDRDAAAALAEGPAPAGLVWYVRGLQTAYGPGRYPAGDYPPRILWVLLDETTGEPLTTGVLTPPGSTAALPATPVALDASG